MDNSAPKRQKVETKAKSDAEAKAKTEAEAKAEAEADAEAKAKSDAEAKAKSEANIEDMSIEIESDIFIEIATAADTLIEIASTPTASTPTASTPTASTPTASTAISNVVYRANSVILDPSARTMIITASSRLIDAMHKLYKMHINFTNATLNVNFLAILFDIYNKNVSLILSSNGSKCKIDYKLLNAFFKEVETKINTNNNYFVKAATKILNVVNNNTVSDGIIKLINLLISILNERISSNMFRLLNKIKAANSINIILNSPLLVCSFDKLKDGLSKIQQDIDHFLNNNCYNQFDLMIRGKFIEISPNI